MIRSSFFKNIPHLFMVAVLLLGQPLYGYAQISSNFGQGLSTGNLGDAVGNAAIDTVENFGNDIGDSFSSDINTGNIFGDAVAQGAADAIGAGLACAIGQFASGLRSGAGAAAGLTVPVSDATVAQTTGASQFKECTLDGLAFALKEGIIKNLIAATITYVNNGFSGGPGYVQNEDAYFQDQSDKLFEQYLENPNNFSSVCSAWEADVRLALASQYSTSVGGRRVTQLSGTGTGTNQPVSSGGQQICPLDNGGYATGETNSDYWGTFLQQTTRTEGNALTSYFNIQEQFTDLVQNEAEKTIRELQRNDGFFDVTYCDDGSDIYNNISGESVSVNNQNCKVTTPGSVINEQLNAALGSDLRRLEQADELNELFSALIGQLINATFSKLGLFGTTQERSGNSNNLLSQYAQAENPAVVAGSRDVLLGLIDEFAEIKRSTIDQLFDARESAIGAYVCYGSKYETWVYPGTTNIIPADELPGIPVGDRERATFVYEQELQGGQTITAYLTPQQSGIKITSYEEALGNIDSYILQTQAEIDAAEFNSDEAQLLKAWLGEVNDADNPLTAALTNSNIVKLIAEKFAQIDTTNLTLISVTLDDGTLVQIPQNLNEQQLLEVFAIASEELAQFDIQAAVNQQRLVEIATIDLIDGVQSTVGGERIGGYNKDLQQCNLFNTVTLPLTTHATSTATTTN